MPGVVCESRTVLWVGGVGADDPRRGTKVGAIGPGAEGGSTS